MSERELKIVTTDQRSLKIKKIKDETTLEDICNKIKKLNQPGVGGMGWCLFNEKTMLELESHSRKVIISTEDKFSKSPYYINSNTTLVSYFNSFVHERLPQPQPLTRPEYNMRNNKISFGDSLVVDIERDNNSVSLYKVENFELPSPWKDPGSNNLFTEATDSESIKFSFQFEPTRLIGLQMECMGSIVIPFPSSVTEEPPSSKTLSGTSIIENKIGKPEGRGVTITVAPKYLYTDVTWYSLKENKMIILDMTKTPSELSLSKDEEIYMYSQTIPSEKLQVGSFGQKIKLDMKAVEPLTIYVENKDEVHVFNVPRVLSVFGLKMAIFNKTGILPHAQTLLSSQSKLKDDALLETVNFSQDFTLRVSEQIHRAPPPLIWNTGLKSSVTVHFWSHKVVASLIDTEEEPQLKEKTPTPTSGSKDRKRKETLTSSEKSEGKNDKKKKKKDKKEESEKSDKSSEVVSPSTQKAVESNEKKDTETYVYVPDKIIQTRVRNGTTEYRIRWKNHEPHEDSWSDRPEIQTKYPAILEEFEKENEPKLTSKRKKTLSDGPLPAPPSKKRGLPKNITKEKITKIEGVKYNAETYKWVLELTDGSHADVSGEELIKLHPSLFLEFVEKRIQRKK